jgi:hypothetical protein
MVRRHVTTRPVGHADYAGCPDTRRSTTGLVFLLNGGPIAWQSHLQKPVAQSTAEAEYYAAGLACREIVWLREDLNQLEIQQLTSSPLHCDSKSAILMMHNSVFHDRTKHIGVKYHYIRQQIQAGEVNVVSVTSSPTSLRSHCRHRHSNSTVSGSESSRGHQQSIKNNL